MKNFFVKLFAFVFVIASIDLSWIHFMPIEKHIPHVWLMLAFFCVLTSLFHFLTLNASKGRPQDFIRYYLGTTALRLFLLIMVIVAYRFFDKSTLAPFTIGFMMHYVLFTAFEVPVLIKELKKS